MGVTPAAREVFALCVQWARKPCGRLLSAGHAVVQGLDVRTPLGILSALPEGARTVSLTPSQIQQLTLAYETEGYVILPGVVAKSLLAQVNSTLLDEFARAERTGDLFEGGGMFHGHLNCFPGAQSRGVYEALREAGVLDLVRTLSPQAVREPNVGCNMNLTGSYAQNYHIDGYASTPFIVVNVAPVDTTLLNGAMEVSPGTHRRSYRYWEFVLANVPGLRVQLSQGDVLIRTSSLWHRGMPNKSKTIRPMLAFSWEDGGSTLPDPYSLYGGEVRFLPNRYASDLAGRIREQAFARLPSVANGYRFARSLLER
jgi:hypothetical protein